MLAHFGEQRPRDRRLLRVAVDVGAQRPGAVSEGAAQREVHALGHIVARPVFLAVGHHGHTRAHVRAVAILCALPDVPLVDVGVHVDEAREGDAAFQVEARQPVIRGSRRAEFVEAESKGIDIPGGGPGGIAWAPIGDREDLVEHDEGEDGP